MLTINFEARLNGCLLQAIKKTKTNYANITSVIEAIICLEPTGASLFLGGPPLSHINIMEFPCVLNISSRALSRIFNGTTQSFKSTTSQYIVSHDTLRHSNSCSTVFTVAIESPHSVCVINNFDKKKTSE
jgi:hypothetical protein